MLFRLAIQLRDKITINKNILVHCSSENILESYLRDITNLGVCLYEIIIALEPNAITLDVLNEEKLQCITESDSVISWDRYCFESVVEEIKIQHQIKT